MEYTNKFNFPDAIVKAVENDGYSKGDCDYSVSGLVNPPRVSQLMSRHASELSVDISENMFALFGTAIHYILEKAEEVPETMVSPLMLKDFLNDVRSGVLNQEDLLINLETIVNLALSNQTAYKPLARMEERLFAKMAGVTLSGKFDRYEIAPQRIEDWKVTSVYKLTKGDFSDYEQRMNIYRWLFYMNDIPVKEMRINAIARDWRRSELFKQNYPPHMVKTLDIPMWDLLRTHDFITERVRVHEQAKHLKDDDLPLCTVEERWEKPTSYGTIKAGGSRRNKTFDTKEEMNYYLMTEGGAKGYVPSIRLGEATRCKDFCSVNGFCNYYQNRLKESEVNVAEVEAGLNKELEFDLPETTLSTAPLVIGKKVDSVTINVHEKIEPILTEALDSVVETVKGLTDTEPVKLNVVSSDKPTISLTDLMG